MHHSALSSMRTTSLVSVLRTMARECPSGDQSNESMFSFLKSDNWSGALPSHYSLSYSRRERKPFDQPAAVERHSAEDPRGRRRFGIERVIGDELAVRRHVRLLPACLGKRDFLAAVKRNAPDPRAGIKALLVNDPPAVRRKAGR